MVVDVWMCVHDYVDVCGCHCEWISWYAYGYVCLYIYDTYMICRTFELKFECEY